MDCIRIKEYLYSFLDGELDSQTKLSVKEHISACPLCSLELEQEKRIDFLFRHNIPKEKAPYDLKEAILNRIGGFEERRFGLFGIRLLRPALVGIAGALLIFVLFSFFNKPFPVFSESVKEHIQFLQGNLPVNIPSHSTKEVHSWLQTKLDFKIMIPDLSSLEAELLGARVCNLKGKEAAYIIYNKGGHNLSVFMFDAKGLRFPKAKKVTVNNKLFHLSKEKGYNSALWIEEGIACVFVSDLTEAELLHLASL